MAVSPVAQVGFKASGYFYARQGGSSTTTQSQTQGGMGATHNLGTTSYGSLSWSGNTLRYNTPATSYLDMHVSIEYHTYDGANIDFDASNRSF